MVLGPPEVLIWPGCREDWVVGKVWELHILHIFSTDVDDDALRSVYHLANERNPFVVLKYIVNFVKTALSTKEVKELLLIE